jgi:hypothetical protein
MPTANIDTLTKDALPKKKIALEEERTLLKTNRRSFIQHNKCSTSEREREGEGGRERERERERAVKETICGGHCFLIKPLSLSYLSHLSSLSSLSLSLFVK